MAGFLNPNVGQNLSAAASQNQGIKDAVSQQTNQAKDGGADTGYINSAGFKRLSNGKWQGTSQGWENVVYGADDKNAVAGNWEDEYKRWQAQQNQQQQAKDFRAGIPGYENQLYNTMQSATYSSLADQERGIKSNANSRGLLYSGMREGAEAGARANAQGLLAQGRAGINSQIETYANQLDQNATQTGLDDFKSQVQSSMNAYQNQLQNDSNQRAQFGQFLQGAGSVAALALVSDKNEKKNIEPSDKDLDDFLGKIDNKKYDYKNPANGEGKHFGFMAQDLEKHPVGKSMVEEHNGVKQVNMAKGLGTILSIQAYLNKKINAKGKG